MPMMQVPEATAAITAATNTGLVTVADNSTFFPGGYAWLNKTTGNEERARVQILRLVGSTQLACRRVANDNEATAQPHYGLSDLSTWNANSRISMEQQLVPYDPAYAKHAVP